MHFHADQSSRRRSVGIIQFILLLLCIGGLEPDTMFHAPTSLLDVRITHSNDSPKIACGFDIGFAVFILIALVDIGCYALCSSLRILR